MRTVLCYGDSLTWGMNALTGERHHHEDQWPAVLGAELGDGVMVVNAGLNGRTTMFDDHGVAADRNGVRILPTILAPFEPIDVMVFMLGSNDLKTFISGSAVAIAQGIKRLVEITRTTVQYGGVPSPGILVVSPPEPLALGPSPSFPLLSPRTTEWHALASTLELLCRELGVAFFDSASVAAAEGGGDGVHLDAANSRAIGTALAPLVAELLAQREAKSA